MAARSLTSRTLTSRPRLGGGRGQEKGADGAGLVDRMGVNGAQAAAIGCEGLGQGWYCNDNC